MAQVVKRLSTGQGRLLNWNRHWVLSAPSFTDSKDVRCFDQSPLRKTADIAKGKRRNPNQNGKRPAWSKSLPVPLMPTQRLIKETGVTSGGAQ